MFVSSDAGTSACTSVAETKYVCRGWLSQRTWESATNPFVILVCRSHSFGFGNTLTPVTIKRKPGDPGGAEGGPRLAICGRGPPTRKVAGSDRIPLPPGPKGFIIVTGTSRDVLYCAGVSTCGTKPDDRPGSV